jgi:PAS domain-containing protein
MLDRQLSTSLASFMLYENEVRKSRDLAEAAALEQEQLTQQLTLQKDRLRRMTELSPLGMYLVSPEGVLREANDKYFDMTGHPRDNIYEKSWMEQIEESSRGVMEEAWTRMTVDKQPWTGELQMKKVVANPVDLNGEAIDYCKFSRSPSFLSVLFRSQFCSEVTHTLASRGRTPVGSL